MSTDQRDRLRSIRTFPSLIKYLRDELDWPIDSDDFEDLTFEYTPEELGIDPASAAKIQNIQRLRPLAVNQPWGIFFVMFEPKRLPVVALRRILSSVAIKKRASANSAERAAWDVDDLLFISNYGEGDQRHISLAHFSRDGGRGDLPTLKVLGWDNLDTPLHLDSVVETLTSRLVWPKDEQDLNSWREGWRAAFQVRHREVITTARDLSIRLAELARAIRDRIHSALAIESAAGPLTKLMKAFQGALVHDLDAVGFADMYAQTIAYGLLSARIADPTKSMEDDLAGHMRTNPFLKELMEAFVNVGSRGVVEGSGIDFDELGVSEVVELLGDANMEAVLVDFGDQNPQEDPVIHFYEHFLAAYDKDQKIQRGVFYTPRPAVSYIVRSVDALLRQEYGLADGLADTTTWGELADREGLEVPHGISTDDVFVQILDPATGTGTFLVEAIDLIHETMVEQWRSEGKAEDEVQALWNEYVPSYLLPRLHGYELLMAPYAIAHLKIGLKLYETGYRFDSRERARVYLTNSLDSATDAEQTEFASIVPALAHEALAVNTVKRDQRFTVLIANPPYANYSANLSAEARALVDKYRSFRGVPIRERNQLQFERNLQDDFVKFLAIAEDAIVQTGVGIIGYITNATMLASTSLRGMREHLLSEFTLLHELHLHGGVNEIGDEARRDQNVFDISQAVGIHLYVRKADLDGAEVSFCELWGPRREKFDFLLSESVASTEWEPVVPDSMGCSFVPQGDTGAFEMARLSEVFVQYGAGIKTNRDAVAIGFSEMELIHSVDAFAPELNAASIAAGCVQPILYRPFDERLIFYHEGVVASRSLPTMQHVMAGPNVGLLASSTWTTPDRFSMGVSRTMVEMKTGTHDRGTTFFPLYRYDQMFGEQFQRQHNLDSEFVKRWERCSGLSLVTSGVSGDGHVAPEDLFHWIYALAYSRGYRQRFRTLLAQGFPIVLFPSSLRILTDMASLGEELISVHLLDYPALSDGTAYAGPPEPEVGRSGWSDGSVWLDARKTSAREGHRATAPGTIRFQGVPEEVWDFHVGGYQVCHKWLKDRRGRALSDEDIVHYQKIVGAIGETVRLIDEIEEVIETNGGWPNAFCSASATEVSAVERRMIAEGHSPYGEGSS